MRIAISGAGIAGPTLAYWLQRSGHEIVLIEKAPQFRTGGYAVDFWGSGYFAGALVPQTCWGLWFRNLVLRLMALGPVGRYFLTRELRDDFVLPSYEF